MIEFSPLGQKTSYVSTYSPSLLFPVSRELGRENLSSKTLGFSYGIDIWNGFELSWLNSRGKPEIALAVFMFPADSPFIVESKSFKLYLNSFNQSSFSSIKEVEERMKSDLSAAVKADVEVNLFHPKKDLKAACLDLPGFCLDDLDIETSTYSVDKSFLKCVSGEKVKEILYTHLLKSNCLATGQPDWGTVIIEYEGEKIDREGLLKYIISYRNHSGFAEHCAEQMFCDLLECCRPDNVTLSIRYTRRGGLDINPVRSSKKICVQNISVWRQ